MIMRYHQWNIILEMRTFTPALLAVFMLLTKVRSSGVFEVRLTSLSNDKGMTSRGECCQSEGGERRCREQCRTFVTICLMHYQNKIVRSYPSCTFGQFATPLLGGNNIDLREETGDGPYSVKLPFTFSWPKSFTLIIEVWHDEYGNRSITEEKRILEVTKTGSLGPSRAWKVGQQGNYHAELTFAYRVVCDQNYYGDGCDRLCKARDDRFGHYVCSHNGTKLCLKGWTGTFCEQAVCHERCNLSHGFCDTPVVCRCRLGWQGEYCDQCVKSPECQHGFCYEPWQCICHQGWTGINCDIDARFCEKRRPCKNGGTCRLDWTSNYTCDCPRGFDGKDCQLARCSDDICLNGGSCVEQASSIQCRCPRGFHGERCEHVRLSCDDVMCQNNGTCVLDDSGRRCLCPVGFIGATCEMDVHECMSSPCENGGTCVDEPGRFWCDCPPGFAGVTCEVVTDPCAGIRCENGGKCSNESGEVKCRCVHGFTGNRCEKPVQPCPPTRCANGGTCIADSTGSWRCLCRMEFKGKTCKTVVNGCHSPACKKMCKSTPLGIKCKSCSKDLLGGGNCQELRMSKETIGNVGRPESVPVISYAEGSFHWAWTLFTILGCITVFAFV